MTLASGALLGCYRIVGPLGAGSTGEVYLAQDERLGRRVALKLLLSRHAQDPDRLRRFEQEARAASALNHPNIITIYEIGNANSDRFIVTEFVEGETLRKRLRPHALMITEALDIAIQVANALEVAHKAGIVHRDIKPENIMLRNDGYVKVVDFGLAKLLDPPGNLEFQANSEECTLPELRTGPGWLLGTPLYMSPEQARGRPVDGRSDLFSLGAVLYEMVAGRPPFAGATTSDVIVSLLREDPAPIKTYVKQAPESLEWIISKSLTKDADRRYQRATELRIDLQRLKRELEGVTENGTATRDDDGDHPKAVPVKSEVTAAILLTPSRWRLLYRALVFIALGIIVYLLLKDRPPPAPAPGMQMSMVTTTGECTDAAISPDGKYVAYATAEGGNQALRLTHLATKRTVPIVAPSAGVLMGLTFSQDSNYIFYIWYGEGSSVASLYQISILGGNPRKLLADIDSAVTFSPDGKQFAFIRNYPRERMVACALFVANVDGTGEHRIAKRTWPEFFRSPAWSPDGKSIVCSTGSRNADRPEKLVEVQFSDGDEKTIASRPWIAIRKVAWFGDGSGLILTAIDQESRLSQIWEVSYPSGKSRRITIDLNDYRGLSLTADSSSLVTVQENQVSNIFVAAPGEVIQARQITSNRSAGSIDGTFGLSWTPDGKIVYVSRASGDEDVWIVEADGSHPRQLTAHPGKDLFPRVSADGRYVVFVSDRAGGMNIWRIDMDGGNAKQLTSGANETHPDPSPDGRWVVYSSYRDGKPTLWKVPIDGGEPVSLTKSLSRSPAVSPDGRLVACSHRDEQSLWRIAVIPFEGGTPVKVYDVAIALASQPGIRWSFDGRYLTYLGPDGGTNIWRQRMAGGSPEQWTHFDTERRIFWFDWSRSGQLACASGTVTRDVVWIRHFK